MTKEYVRSLIQGMTWSYSRITSFDSCRYKWYLRYILNLPGDEMFFASYGSFMHRVLERFYSGELKQNDMESEYLVGFRENVVGRAPNRSVFQSYFSDGLRYLQAFQPLPYKTLAVEQKFSFDVEGIPFVGIVDQICEDSFGNIIIVDNKSRSLKPNSGRAKPTKNDMLLDEYMRQLYLYSIPVEREYGKAPIVLCLNCFRVPTIISEETRPEKKDMAVQFVKNMVSDICQADSFSPDVDYFRCTYLCEMHSYCEYWNLARG